jgi:hypothetical protein
MVEKTSKMVARSTVLFATFPWALFLVLVSFAVNLLAPESYMVRSGCVLSPSLNLSASSG